MVKNILMVAVICVGLALGGCASDQAYTGYRDSFDQAAFGYYEAAGKPLVDLSLPAPEGQEYHLVVNRQVEPMLPQQEKDNEWVGPVSGLIDTVKTITGLAVVVNGAGTRTETIHGDYVKGYQSNPVSTSTTTTSTAP